MEGMFVSIVGMKNYLGNGIFKPGMILKCVKEPDNNFDEEAIRVEIKHLGIVGYLGNSPYTVARGTKSAGFIYNFVNDVFFIEVGFITSNCIVSRVIEGIKKKEDVYFENNLNRTSYDILNSKNGVDGIDDLSKYSIVKL